MNPAYEPTGALDRDTDVAVKALQQQARDMQSWLDYYEGRQPLNYISRAMQQLLDQREANSYDYVINVMSLVVDAYYDRLELERVEAAGSPEIEQRANEWLNDPDTTIELEEVMRAALIYPVSYAMVYPDADGVPELRAQDPRYTVTFGSPQDSRRVTMAAKWWEGVDGGEKGRRLNLYYPDRLVRLFRKSTTGGIVSSRGFRPIRDDEAEVPYDGWVGVPIVPVQTRRPEGRSIFADILSEQNRINQLSAAKLIAQEFGILPQRYIIGSVELVEGGLRTGPNEIWPLPDGSQAGQFPGMDLAVFDTAIDREIDRIVAKKRLPRWYVQMQGGDPSGEALKTSEAGMVKHVRELQLYLGSSARPLFELYAAMLGQPGVQFREVWESPESQAITADIQQFDSLVKAGVPLRTALRTVFDWTDDQFEEMDSDRTTEAAGQPGALGNLLMQGFNAAPGA